LLLEAGVVLPIGSNPHDLEMLRRRAAKRGFTFVGAF